MRREREQPFYVLGSILEALDAEKQGAEQGKDGKQGESGSKMEQGARDAAEKMDKAADAN